MPNGWHRKRDTPAARRRARDYASPEHQRVRAQRVAQATPDTPCACQAAYRAGLINRAWCDGQPLGPNPTDWHVPHDEHRRYLPGLWRADCNRREAASRGAKLRNALERASRTSNLTW